MLARRGQAEVAREEGAALERLASFAWRCAEGFSRTFSSVIQGRYASRNSAGRGASTSVQLMAARPLQQGPPGCGVAAMGGRQVPRVQGRPGSAGAVTSKSSTVPHAFYSTHSLRLGFESKFLLVTCSTISRARLTEIWLSRVT